MCTHKHTEICLPVTWKMICKIVTLAWHFWTLHSSQCPQQAKLFYFITSIISTFSLPTLIKSPPLLSDLPHLYFLTAPFSLVRFQTSFIQQSFTQSSLITCDNFQWREAPTNLQVWWGAVRALLSSFRDCRQVTITPSNGNNFIPSQEGFRK